MRRESSRVVFITEGACVLTAVVVGIFCKAVRVGGEGERDGRERRRERRLMMYWCLKRVLGQFCNG